MPVVARTVSFFAERLLRRFDTVSQQPEVAQQGVLDYLVRQGTQTQWGREVGLGEVRTPEQFSQRIPITRYEEASGLWHRAFEGARNVTWPGHVGHFALSSGTTAGNKLLPVTAAAIKSNLRAGALLTAMMMRRGNGGKMFSGKFLYLGGATALRQRGRCLYGDASGIMGSRIPFYIRRRRLPESDVAALSDWDQKITQIVQRHLTSDIRLMSGCPSWAALLFKQLLHEAQTRGLPQKTIGALWPNFSFFVSYGMAFEPYRTAFAQYIGRDIHYIDTYSSSEGGMNGIQEEDGGPLRLIVNNGVYFEFIPADRAHEPNPPRLHIGQVQEGADYALIMSTNGGIWAYPLGDVIRFESLRPPRFRFVGRTQIMLSAFGEHVTLEMIEKAVAAACRQTGAIVADYSIEPLYPSPQRAKPGHRWIMEFDRPPADPAAFMVAIDRSIRAENEDYDTHRTHDFGMDPPVLVAVAPQTFYTWMKRKGKLGGQNKVPRVIRNEEAVVLLEISQELAAGEFNGTPHVISAS